MRCLIFVVVMPICLTAQQLVASFSVDTSLYTSVYVSTAWEPEVRNYESPFGFWRKNSGQIDIFSRIHGKIGTTTAPSLPTGTIAAYTQVEVSQLRVDGDSGWEGIVNFIDTTGVGTTTPKWRFQFKAFSEDGTVLLSDFGRATFLREGTSTYIVAGYYSGRTFLEGTLKAWRFRTNAGSAGPSLSKHVATENPSPIFTPAGDLRLTSLPIGNGEMSIQLIDMLGRIVHSSIIPANQSSTFTIPSSSVPSSPFVTKVATEERTTTQRMIPQR